MTPRWAVVMERWLARLNGSASITAIIGSAGFYPMSAARPAVIPSVEYLVYGDRETELFNLVSVRMHLYVRGQAAAIALEGAIRDLSHSDVEQDLGAGIRGWIRYSDGRDIDYPSEPGVVHRALDFDLETVRTTYLT